MNAGIHARHPKVTDPAISVWACQLMAPILDEPLALAPAEAAHLRQLHERLLAALQARDRAALRSARQSVLAAALIEPGSTALRARLRALAWRMAALLPRKV